MYQQVQHDTWPWPCTRNTVHGMSCACCSWVCNVSFAIATSRACIHSTASQPARKRHLFACTCYRVRRRVEGAAPRRKPASRGQRREGNLRRAGPSSSDEARERRRWVAGCRRSRGTPLADRRRTRSPRKRALGDAVARGLGRGGRNRRGGNPTFATLRPHNHTTCGAMRRELCTSVSSMARHRPDIVVVVAFPISHAGAAAGTVPSGDAKHVGLVGRARHLAAHHDGARCVVTAATVSSSSSSILSSSSSS